jgi:hypothetical protein
MPQSQGSVPTGTREKLRHALGVAAFYAAENPLFLLFQLFRKPGSGSQTSVSNQPARPKAVLFISLIMITLAGAGYVYQSEQEAQVAREAEEEELRSLETTIAQNPKLTAEYEKMQKAMHLPAGDPALLRMMEQRVKRTN